MRTTGSVPSVIGAPHRADAHRLNVFCVEQALRTDASRIVSVPPALGDEVSRNTAPQQSSQSAQNIGSSALSDGLVPNGGSSRLAVWRWGNRASDDIRTDVRFSMRVLRSAELLVAHNRAQSRSRLPNRRFTTTKTTDAVLNTASAGLVAAKDPSGGLIQSFGVQTDCLHDPFAEGQKRPTEGRCRR